MLAALLKLAKTIDFLDRSQARQIVDGVNQVVQKKLGAYIVDVLWRQEAKGGTSILYPITSVNPPTRRAPQPFEVGPQTRNLLAYAFRERKKVWLEEIRNKNLSAAVMDASGTGSIPPEYLDVHNETDSIMVVPLLFRGTTWGVYSIELRTSGQLNKGVLDFLERLSEAAAIILWKADASQMNHDQTDEAVKEFVASLQALEGPGGLTTYRTGFAARPFDAEFQCIEERVKDKLRRRQILVQSVTSPATHIIDRIKEQIHAAHFGVVDLTGLNSNVLIELGMMMSENKKVLMFCKQNNPAEFPFDVRSYNIHRYERADDCVIRVLDPAGDRWTRMEDIIDAFVDDVLFNDPSFTAALPWESE